MHPLMDSSILKLLEEDEDETMHSGADVEALTAALNRDIEGCNTSSSQPSTTTDVASALFQGTNPTPSQLFQQWQSSKLEEEIKAQIQEEGVKPQIREHQSSATKINQHGSASEVQHPPNDTSRGSSHVPSESSRTQDDQHYVYMSQALNTQHTEKNPDQRVQKMGIQQAANAMNKQSERQVPFGVLLPVIKPQLDKDRAMQLMGLYARLKNNNITKEDFVRRMRALVGDHMLKMAVFKSQQGNPAKILSVGQKKPLEAPVSSPSKKQKVSGSCSDQNIEQLNDVTAVSGVNLREEEEQLLSGSREESQVSEASRKVVQEEEERLLLQKIPLQNKVAKIMARCGVKNRSNDVDRCLSLCVEERMRGLISNLIRLSKQRADIEKPRHRTVITSDIRQQIMSMNQKAREEWEKKQADAEKLQKEDVPDGSGDVKSSKKVNKEEDDRVRNAANIAALAAVGGDDRLSKWQLMAEQSRQRREGGPDPTSSQPSFDVRPKIRSTPERIFKDYPDTGRTSGSVIATPGQVRKSLRNQVLARRISVKDVICVLEREIQMSRSPLIYRLYEKVPPNLQGST